MRSFQGSTNRKRRSRLLPIIMSVCAAAACSLMARSPGRVRAFRTAAPLLSRRATATARNALSLRGDADLGELMVGGERYSLVPMPHSMKATTVFVGNLDEFVHDDDLSELFAMASSLNSVPATVVRKPDTQSMLYGFVSFPTKKEKEASERHEGRY